MITEIRINGQSIDLPEDGLEIKLEEESPLKDNVLTVGDFAQSFSLPGTGNNRQFFNHNTRIDMQVKRVKYDDVVIYDRFLGSILGKLEVKENEDEFGEINYACDFITNLLKIDIFNKKLYDILTGSTNLGSTSAAIRAAAKAQNNAPMSADGATGAVMKFVTHFNPEFYGDTNPDFYPDTNPHDREKGYSKGDYVTQILAENDARRQNSSDYTLVAIQDYAVPSGLNEVEFDITTIGKWQDGMFDTDRITFTEEAKYKVRVVARVKYTGTAINNIVLALRPSMTTSGVLVAETVFFEFEESRTVAIQAYTDASAGDELFFACTPSSADFEIVQAVMEVHKIEKHPAMPPMRFIALDDIPAQSTRENNAYWELEPAGVINQWRPAANDFVSNEPTKRTDRTYLDLNRNTLVPWLQIHLVIRELAKELGYTVSGEYFNDTVEQRALLYSNKAQDKLSPRDNYAYVGSKYFETTPGLNAISFDRLSGVFDNSSGVYDTANDRYECATAGRHKIRLHVVWRNRTGVSGSLRVALRSSFTSGDVYWENSGQEFIDDLEIGETNVEIIEDLSVGDHVFAALTQDGDYYEVISAEMEIQNIDEDDINVFEGNVKYADHVPDMTAADFLEALRVAKNLYIYFDGKNRNLQIDYADNILKSRADMLDVNPYLESKQKIRLRAKKRFQLNYGNLPDDTFSPDDNYNQVDAVNAFDDLEMPSSKEDAVIVRSLNCWFTAVIDAISKVFQWQLTGSNYPDLLVEEQQEGDDLYEVKPDLGPVPMGIGMLWENSLAAMPVFAEKGRSSSFNTNGKRPSSIRVAYWIGIDTSTVADGYPHANTTGTNSAGSAVLSRSMSWADQFTAFWKRTLQTLVFEEIVIRSFILPAEADQQIQWNRLLLLDHSPMLLIKRLRALGSTQRQQLEMRKVKSVGVKVVGQEVVIEEEPELWTPNDILNADFMIWLDGADESSITKVSNNVSAWVDKSGNDNHALQGVISKQPIYDAGKMAVHFSGSANKSLKSSGLSFTQGFAMGVFEFGSTGYFIDGQTSFKRFGLRYFQGNLYIVDDANQSLNTGLSITTAEKMLLGANLMHGSGRGFKNGETSAEIDNASYFNLKTDVTFGNFAGESVVMNGWIYEVIVFSAAPNLFTRQLIEGYLAHKWGTALNLVEGHPYKTEAPTI